MHSLQRYIAFVSDFQLCANWPADDDAFNRMFNAFQVRASRRTCSRQIQRSPEDTLHRQLGRESSLGPQGNG